MRRFSSLEAGSLYTFLVGDRVAEVSMFGESEAFQVMAVAAVTSSTADEDDDDDDGAGGEDAVAEDAEDDGDSDGFRWGVVIGAVAGAPFLP